MTLAVEAKDLSKVFWPHSRYRVGLKSLLIAPRKALQFHSAEPFVALDGVSFEIPRGETFGVIGRNGAGKSTLLSLIGGILRPTSGRISVRGHVCPLLELGVGFEQELTGRENITLNGVLLGLRRREIDRRVDDIIEFSGLSRFMDTLLKGYSSGMQIRLGFSIAVHSNPEILLVDEIMAVGDAEFRARCLERIAALRAEQSTIVYVSHDLQTVAAISDRVAWLDGGRLIEVGDPEQVVARYEHEVGAQRDDRETTRATLGRPGRQ